MLGQLSSQWSFENNFAEISLFYWNRSDSVRTVSGVELTEKHHQGLWDEDDEQNTEQPMGQCLHTVWVCALKTLDHSDGFKTRASCFSVYFQSKQWVWNLSLQPMNVVKDIMLKCLALPKDFYFHMCKLYPNVQHKGDSQIYIELSWRIRASFENPSKTRPMFVGTAKP